MANKIEILQELRPLLTAFEKHWGEDLSELWVSELKECPLGEIRRAVQSFLNSPSQKTFPRIGEFKAATGRDGRPSRREGADLPSCSRCTHGICSTTRFLGKSGPLRFSWRCSCPSGSQYPGLPPVSAHEQTDKEARAARKRAWTDQGGQESGVLLDVRTLARTCLKTMDGIEQSVPNDAA